MTDHSQAERDAEAYRSVLDALVAYACWPVPPAAWGRLFVAGAALSELHDPAPPHPDGRMKTACLHLMIRILDRACLDLEDHRQIRVFLPLVRGRSKPADSALRRAEELLGNGELKSGHEGAVKLLEQLKLDATQQMLRGLTAGVGESQADEDRPDLAEGLHNPYDLADLADRVRGNLESYLVDLIRKGSPDTRFMDRLAALVPLAEASAELRGTHGLAPDELRVLKTDETLMRILERIGPDLMPEPVRVATRQDPTVRRKGLPSSRPEGPHPDNPYLGFRMIGLQNRLAGDSLDRLRDHVRSLRCDGGKVSRDRRLPVPDDLDALDRTLKRIHAGR